MRGFCFFKLWIGLLIGYLLVEALPASGQTDIHLLELPQPSAELRQMPIPFHVMQVIDARPYQSSLGSVRRGINNTAMEVNFSKGLALELTDFMNRWLVPQAPRKPLLLRITSLRANEYLSSTDLRTTAELTAEWYYPGPDGRFHFIRYSSHHMDKVTALKGRHITDLLVATVADVAKSIPTLPTPTADTPAFTLAQLQLPQPPRDFPILTTTTPQAGIYHTFDEWQQNRPSEPGRPIVDARPYHTHEWAGYLQVSLYRPTPEGRRVPVSKVWGFSDGERVYVWFIDAFYLLEKRGPNFLFFAPAPPLYSQNGAMMGGLLGGALGGSMLSRSTDGHKFPFGLDAHTGQIAPYGSAAQGTNDVAARPTTLFLLYPRESKSAPEVQIAAPGATPRALAPNDYVSYSWPAAPVQPLCLTVQGASAACQTLELAAGSANYYQLMMGAAPGEAPVLRRLTPKDGAVLLNRLMR